MKEEERGVRERVRGKALFVSIYMNLENKNIKKNKGKTFSFNLCSKKRTHNRDDNFSYF